MYKGFEDNKVKKKIIFSALKSDCKVFVRLPFTFRLNSANCVIKWILTVGFCTFIYVIHFILLNELPSFFISYRI